MSLYTILFAYKTQEHAATAIKLAAAKLDNLGIHYTMNHTSQSIQFGTWRHFYHCVTKDNVLRYGGLELHSVVFHPHEDAFDKDVVQFLKSRERTLK